MAELAKDLYTAGSAGGAGVSEGTKHGHEALVERRGLQGSSSGSGSAGGDIGTGEGEDCDRGRGCVREGVVVEVVVVVVAETRQRVAIIARPDGTVRKSRGSPLVTPRATHYRSSTGSHTRK